MTLQSAFIPQMQMQIMLPASIWLRLPRVPQLLLSEGPCSICKPKTLCLLDRTGSISQGAADCARICHGAGLQLILAHIFASLKAAAQCSWLDLAELPLAEHRLGVCRRAQGLRAAWNGPWTCAGLCRQKPSKRRHSTAY